MAPVFALHLFDLHQFIYIFTSIYFFFLLNIELVAIQYRCNGMTGYEAQALPLMDRLMCAYIFAIDIERLSHCHAHLHSWHSCIWFGHSIQHSSFFHTNIKKAHIMSHRYFMSIKKNSRQRSTNKMDIWIETNPSCEPFQFNSFAQTMGAPWLCLLFSNWDYLCNTQFIQRCKAIAIACVSAITMDSNKDFSNQTPWRIIVK